MSFKEWANKHKSEKGVRRSSFRTEIEAQKYADSINKYTWQTGESVLSIEKEGNKWVVRTAKQNPKGWQIKVPAGTFVAKDGTVCKTKEEMEKLNRKIDWIMHRDYLWRIEDGIEYHKNMIPKLKRDAEVIKRKMEELKKEGF